MSVVILFMLLFNINGLDFYSQNQLNNFKVTTANANLDPHARTPLILSWPKLQSVGGAIE